MPWLLPDNPVPLAGNQHQNANACSLLGSLPCNQVFWTLFLCYAYYFGNRANGCFNEFKFIFLRLHFFISLLYSMQKKQPCYIYYIEMQHIVMYIIMLYITQFGGLKIGKQRELHHFPSQLSIKAPSVSQKSIDSAFCGSKKRAVLTPA